MDKNEYQEIKKRAMEKQAQLVMPGFTPADSAAAVGKHSRSAKQNYQLQRVLSLCIDTRFILDAVVKGLEKHTVEKPAKYLDLFAADWDLQNCIRQLQTCHSQLQTAIDDALGCSNNTQKK